MSFPLSRSLSTAGLLAVLVAPSLGATSGGDDDLVILQFLASTGADADGTARARYREKDDGSTDFSVELEDVDSGDYELFVEDDLGALVEQGTITVSAGEGEIEFETPQDGVKPLLDFTVLERMIEVRQSATVFFSDVFHGSGGDGGGGDDGDKTKTEIFLVNVGPDFNAKGKMKYEVKGAKTKFSVEIENVAAGDYDLVVGGTTVSVLTVGGSDEAEVEFQDPVEPGKTLLNFDPLGQLVEVSQGEVVYLAGVLPGSNTDTGIKAPKSGKKSATDLGKGKGDALLVLLQNTGVLAGAQGEVSFSQDDDESELEIEIEDVPAGDYALLVDGVAQGTISVPAGELKFHTSPDVGEELLDFEVKGQALEVQSGGETILSTVFPISVPAALGKSKKESFKETSVKVNLVNAGEDLDATGFAKWKLKGDKQVLSLKIADLPVGSYDVLVGGVEIGTGALAVTKADGKAKVTFDSEPSAKELPLGVDVADQTVTVVDESDTVLLQAVIDVP